MTGNGQEGEGRGGKGRGGGRKTEKDERLILK
jgi:hypothetical protein